VKVEVDHPEKGRASERGRGQERVMWGEYDQNISLYKYMKMSL
jgi:hypothetical protein